MNINDRLELIDTRCSSLGSEFSGLITLSNDADQEVRYRSLECLGDILSGAIGRIREGLADPDEIVCTTCLEILGGIRDRSVFNEIACLLKSESALVRSAAAIAIGDLRQAEGVGILQLCLASENDDEVKVSIYSALYELGVASYLNDIFGSLLNSNFYRARCAAANLLVKISDDDNRERILRELHKAASSEETVAGISSISDAINIIEKRD